MAVTVTVPQRLTGQAVIPFPSEYFEDYTVDARGLQWVEPAGLVQLVLLVQHLAALSPWVTFQAPTSHDNGYYLSRMEFYSHVPAHVSVDGAVDPASMRRTDCSNVLIPVRRFSTWNDVENMFEDVLKFLQGAAAAKVISAAAYTTLTVAIPELCDNAASHSQSPCGGFLVAQTYRHGSYMAVGDIGIGIRQHLARNPLYAGLRTDEAAVRKALQRGVTGTRDRRGYGYDVIVEELERFPNAELYIRSGTGWVRTAVTTSGKHVSSGTGKLDSSGTLVQLIVRS